ncbi:hypothetical protein PoB_005074600 [Plakobranchus ocellatus]|uniref:Uncharacterized protein n=1 Tax=Plakobranchus ocellatus TaxID=259542 RepID=A0AAV4BYP9_9GAST|nr:hypothetical protein PoB_005074600 [Plakobranchus ocellatus]
MGVSGLSLKAIITRWRESSLYQFGARNLISLPHGPNGGYACESKVDEIVRNKSIHKRNTSDGQKTHTDCLSLIYQRFEKEGISSDSVKILPQGWRESTQKQ